jgi:hypothetical protein
MPMTFRRRSIIWLRRAVPRAALLLALALTAACGSLAGPTDSTSTSPLSPDYRSMIAKRLKTVLKDAVPGGIEISDPRWAQSNKGWGWMVCVHFPDRGHQRTYVYFFDRSDFIDERYAVQTDHCEAQTYSAFDLGPAIRPGAVGDPGPLY